MRRATLSLLGSALIIGSVGIFPSTVASAFNESEAQYLVTFSTQPTEQAISEALNIPADAIDVDPRLQLANVIVPASESARVEAQLTKLPGAATVERDEPFQISFTPNDPYLGNQNASLEQVGAPLAWDSGQGRSSQIIAVLDTGINGTHPDLSGRVIQGKNILTDASISANSDSDDNGHGTSVAGVVAATGNNGIGIAGLNWNARIMPVKAFDASGTGTTTDVINGINYAVANGASVIVMSFGRSTPSDALATAVNYAAGQGVILVAASGNDGVYGVNYPAAYDAVVGVGAVDESGIRPSFSNYGPELDLAAPGVGVFTTADSGGYTAASGTSLSAPFVAGAVSLLREFHPDYGRDAIIAGLKDAATKVSQMGTSSRVDEYGYGIVNIGRAITMLPSYSASFVSQSSYPTIGDGQTTTMTITYRNTGATTWQRGTVNLGTVDTNYQYRLAGYELAHNWISGNRPAYLNEASVAPGEVGSFTFQLQNPGGLGEGNYRLDVGLVADGITWFNRGTHAYWDVVAR